MLFDPASVQRVELLKGNLVCIDTLHLVDNDLHHAIVQLRHTLDTHIASLGKPLRELLIGIPTHPGDHSAAVLKLEQQIRVALSVGPELAIGDPEDCVDLGLWLQVGDVLTLRRVWLHVLGINWQ